MRATTFEVRPYETDDEAEWLRCRVLSFLDTAYFDDVKTAKTSFERPAIELVARVGGRVSGIIDVEVDGDAATIDTVAVHPEQMRGGIATGLLGAALDALPSNVTTLDAWTRDDEAANAWYQRQGFIETFRYLHVYASSDTEISDAVVQLAPALVAVKAFFHAPISAEATMRSSFERVHICRRYERVL